MVDSQGALPVKPTTLMIDARESSIPAPMVESLGIIDIMVVVPI